MEFIDLGLSVKWADCNYGASLPEVFGLYQTWHEATERKYKSGRLPTKEEFLELHNKCKWEWVEINSVPGYKLTAPNGNSIFLPAAGYYNGSSWNAGGTGGYYWSSTYAGSYAYGASFGSSYVAPYGSDVVSDYFPVRLVK